MRICRKIFFVDPQVLPGQAVILRASGENDEHENCGNKLGDDRRVGNPLDGHAEAHYKKKVKADIHDTGETEEVQRPLRIANGTQDSTSHVVYKQTENAGKIDL